MDWFFYALLGASLFTIFSIYIKVTLFDEKDVKIFTVLLNSMTGVVLLILSFFTERFISLSLSQVGLILLASLLFAAASMLIISARQKEEVGKVTIVRQAAILWVLLGGIIIFQENLTLQKVVGVVLILSGGILSLWKNHEFKVTKSLFYVFIATILISIDAMIANSIIDDNLSPALYSGTVISLGVIWQSIALKHTFSRLKRELIEHRTKFVIPSLLMSGSMFSLLKGYQQGAISQVYPVYSVYLILTVLAGIIFLKERELLGRKIFGSLLVFLGIVLIRLFG